MRSSRGVSVVVLLGGCSAASGAGTSGGATPTVLPGATSAAATTTTSSTTAPTTVAALNQVKVLGSGSQSVAALQKFADDVAAGKISNLTTQCWTFAAERIIKTFTEDGRRAFLKAVSTKPNAGQYGLEWSADDTIVNASWAELGSSYACPHVSGGVAPDSPRSWTRLWW